MNKSPEEKIIEFIDKDVLSIEESLKLIDELYWANWDVLDENPNHIDKIFRYLKEKDFSNKEVSQILKLYNNPHGAYVEEFSNIIVNLYNKDKAKFIKSLSIEKEEAINLVYIFRTHEIKLDEDKELLELIQSEELSEDEGDTAEKFIKQYETVCNTWV